MRTNGLHTKTLVLALSTIVSSMAFLSAQAQTLSISDSPLFLNGTVAPLNMLVMGRDHKLYYEAYNDHSDLDGDGEVDVGYKPDKITYYGYFDSYKCYTYSESSARFEPSSKTDTKKCAGASEWSGDWLNYVTTARIDALRKVLYGGLRSTDRSRTTVLERSHVPQDAHSWGKSYESVAHDGYDITEYTPLSLPAANSAHLFANTTLRADTDEKPLLRYMLDKKNDAGGPLKIWNWVSIEQPVAQDKIVTGTKSDGTEHRVDAGTITDRVVRVKVCDKDVGLEPNCRAYTDSDGDTSYKPTGLLQEFGEQDLMKFGLITGSYAKNTDGGVLRRRIGSVKNEINDDGTFKDTDGIISTLNRLRTTGFTTDRQYSCGWKVDGPISSGQCQMWGNPIAEMMYEGLRYFAGKKAATADFAITAGQGEESQLPGGGLPVATWNDPYQFGSKCAKPFETVISDINPSYDSDKVPGTAFGSYSGDLPGLNASAIGQKIFDAEITDKTQKFYIGRSLSDPNDDKAPTPKTVTSFGNIRGLSPEEPTKEGSYYSASVAYYGATKDLNAATGDQKVSTFAVALASPLPRIEIPVGDKKITLVPFAKSVGGGVNGDNIEASSSDFQPTNQIVDFYVDTLSKTYGKFRVNYEDVEQGADHDMDAIVSYEYTVKDDGSVDITLTSEYAAGSIIQHIGYVISGTDGKDGIYFEVRDTDTSTDSDPDYYLDTPPGFDGKPPALSYGTGTWKDKKALPLVHTRNFKPGSTSGAGILKDPLWYAAKWGGFKDSDQDDTPNLTSEWDENGDGDPDNYFLVTNALTLSQQLTKAFNEILARVASVSSASVNSGSISSDTRVYQAKFNSGDWSGQLLSFPVRDDGQLDPQEWDAGAQIPAYNSRTILTVKTDGTPIAFDWDDLDTAQQTLLEPSTGDDDIDGKAVVEYLRGNDKYETKNGGPFRKRNSALGDIVNSTPIFVGTPPFQYKDSSYIDFRNTYKDRTQMVYAGGNDGMLHGFDASTGVEKMAFIPSPVFRNLPELTKPGYSHHFYVDGTPSMGDVVFDSNWHTVLVGGLNKGGQGIYALDITDPSKFTETAPDDTYLWQFTDANDADLGYTYSRPAIVQVRTSTGTRWAAVFGNGYNNTLDDTAVGGKKSTTGNAVLYIVDIKTGAIIQKIDTTYGMTKDPLNQSRPNGLATPAMVDINGDSIVDYAFAGDLFGNMWKFDLTNTDSTKWGVAFGGKPFYTAKGPADTVQPITERPEVGRGPRGRGMIVLFGTGKYLETNDNDVSTLTTQSFYGLLDPNTATATPITDRTELTKQEIIYEATATFDGNAVPVRATTQNTVENRGWYLDLISAAPGVPPPEGFKGEMQVSDPALRNGRVIFTTIIPSKDPCSFGGTSWLMELDALSGGRLPFTPFDLTDDKIFDNNDYVTLPDGTKVSTSGRQSEVGQIGRPGFLAGKNNTEYKYESGTASKSGSTSNMQIVPNNPGPGDTGRQSWRQLR